MEDLKMSIAMTIYLWELIGNLNSLFVALMIFSACTLVFCGAGYISTYLDKAKDYKKTLSWLTKVNKICAIVFVISLTFTVIVPSKNTVAMMYVIPRVAESEIAQRLPGDANVLYEEGFDALKDLLKVNEK
jgi:hypothetical protein